MSSLTSDRNTAHVTQCIFLGAVCFVIAAGSFLQACSARQALGAPPENGGDADSYERLGCNLATGLGFGYCPTDSSIVTGAAEPAAGDCRNCGCSPAEFSPTAYRPPAFPAVIAAVYSCSPLNYSAVRLINLLSCAAAVALVCGWFSLRCSRLHGLLAGLLVSCDPRVREFAGSFLTENLATLMLCTFALLLTKALEKQTVRWIVPAGLSFSALVMTRSFFVAWYPAIGLVVLTAFLTAAGQHRMSRRSALLRVAVFVVASCSLTAPWWVRNCLVLGAFMPTGTQGGIGIADAFSDSAVASHGSWTSQTADRIAAGMRRDPAFAQLSPIAFEREHARQGAAHARAWIRAHPDQLVRLSWWKFSRLWELSSVLHVALFLVMTVGLWQTRGTMLCRVVLLMFLLNTLTVVATYHTYERFLLPFRPLIHGFVATGLLAMLNWLPRIPQRPQSTVLQSS